MFGFVRPYTADLTQEEKARYRAVYCGLCRVLNERYGLAGRLGLNYDMTFLTLLLGSWIGSYGGAAMIVAGLLAVILVILFIVKDKPFRGTFAKLFIKLFFDEKEELPVDPES